MNTNYCAYVDKGLRLTFKSDQNNQLATNVRPCCMTHREKIPRNDYRYAKVDAQSILEHPTRVHFQNWFKENTSHLHPACNVCTNLEKAMSPSPRTEMNSIAKNHTDFDILRLDVDLSNTCNLACVFCNSHASSLIETVSAKYQKEELPEHWRTHTDKQPKNADITNLLADIIRNYKVKSIHIKGGEPLLVENWKPIEKVLDEILKNGFSINHIGEIKKGCGFVNVFIFKKIAKANPYAVNPHLFIKAKRKFFSRKTLGHLKRGVFTDLSIKVKTLETNLDEVLTYNKKSVLSRLNQIDKKIKPTDNDVFLRFVGQS